MADALDPEEYWVELTSHEGDPRTWQDENKHSSKLKLPELTLVVHNWKTVDEKGSVPVTLTLFDADSQESAKGEKTKKKDEPFAALKLVLTRTEKGIVANPAKKDFLSLPPKKLHIESSPRKADFRVWIGKTPLMFRISRSDLHDELADGIYEVGFTMEEEGGVTYTLPEGKSPAWFRVSKAIDDMLSLPDRFSDTGRKPNFPAAEAAKRHEKETLALLAQERGKAKPDVDIDGLRFDLLLDGSMSRRAFIDSMVREGGKALTCKVRELFKDQVDPKLKGDDKNILKSQWTTGDIVKAYFVIHDYGILTNNRTELHYKANKESIRWRNTGNPTAVHGFLNWGGVYAPGWNFSLARYGTKASFKGKPVSHPVWGPFTIEIETCPLPYYRPGPDNIDELERQLSEKDPAKQREDWLPAKLTKVIEKKKYVPASAEFACMNWKYPEGWGDRKKVAQQHSYPKPGRKEVAFTLGATTKQMMTGLVDLYLLASARAGHLLTVTTHYEVDRTLGGHSDPTGIDLDVFYAAVTNRIAKKGNDKLPGLGGLDIPVGARYGQHPRRLSSEPILWRGIPLSRLHSGNNKVSYTTDFPKQSTLPTIKS